MATKLHLYMRSGVREYWIADLENESIIHYSFSQDREVESLNIVKTGETIKSAVFEGLEIAVQDLFNLS